MSLIIQIANTGQSRVQRKTENRLC